MDATAEICTFPPCFIPVNQITAFYLFSFGHYYKIYSNCFKILDVTLVNISYAHLLSWYWSTFNNINFGKTWSF